MFSRSVNVFMRFAGATRWSSNLLEHLMNVILLR